MAKDSRGEIDFERAVFSGSTPVAAARADQLCCASCHREIRGVYFAAGEAPVCESCRAGLAEHFAAGPNAASLLRAALFGLGAGIAGAILWTGITAMSGYQIGLVALVVSWAVGSAVRRGSGGLGGPLYQAIAVLLTYLAIVSTYMPGIAAAVAAQEAAVEAELTEPQAGVVQAGQLDSVILVVGIAASLPILRLFDAPMGSLIIAFALYDAWRRNKRAQVEFSGPLRVGGDGVP